MLVSEGSNNGHLKWFKELLQNMSTFFFFLKLTETSPQTYAGFDIYNCA